VHPRVTEEWDEITSTYPQAEYRESPDRIELSIDLVPGLYNQTRTQLAVTIPPGYRATPLDGFLVPSGLQMQPSPLPASDASGVGFPGWLLVSFHLIDALGQSTWRPSANPRWGDNFVGYMASIESFLARGCN
jgi:hypothetical protein